MLARRWDIDQSALPQHSTSCSSGSLELRKEVYAGAGVVLLCYKAAKCSTFERVRRHCLRVLQLQVAGQSQTDLLCQHNARKAHVVYYHGIGATSGRRTGCLCVHGVHDAGARHNRVVY